MVCENSFRNIFADYLINQGFQVTPNELENGILEITTSDLTTARGLAKRSYKEVNFGGEKFTFNLSPETYSEIEKEARTGVECKSYTFLARRVD